MAVRGLSVSMRASSKITSRSRVDLLGDRRSSGRPCRRAAGWPFRVASLGHHDVEVGVVERGHRVGASAHALDRAVDVARAQLVRALEEHVLLEVGVAELVGPLVADARRPPRGRRRRCPRRGGPARSAAGRWAAPGGPAAARHSPAPWARERSAAAATGCVRRRMPSAARRTPRGQRHAVSSTCAPSKSNSPEQRPVSSSSARPSLPTGRPLLRGWLTPPLRLAPNGARVP